MRVSLCVSIGAVFMFLAGYGYAEKDAYTVTGSLHVSSDGPEKQVCELRIGNGSDARKKLLLVSASGMALAQFCREAGTEHVTLTLRVSSPQTKDSDLARSGTGTPQGRSAGAAEHSTAPAAR